MVTVKKSRSGAKSNAQQRREDIKNRQSCSMRYRKEVKVSVKPAPWDNNKGEDGEGKDKRETTRPGNA